MYKHCNYVQKIKYKLKSLPINAHFYCGVYERHIGKIYQNKISCRNIFFGLSCFLLLLIFKIQKNHF